MRDKQKSPISADNYKGHLTSAIEAKQLIAGINPDLVSGVESEPVQSTGGVLDRTTSGRISSVRCAEGLLTPTPTTTSDTTPTPTTTPKPTPTPTTTSDTTPTPTTTSDPTPDPTQTPTTTSDPTPTPTTTPAPTTTSDPTSDPTPDPTPITSAVTESVSHVNLESPVIADINEELPLAVLSSCKSTSHVELTSKYANKVNISRSIVPNDKVMIVNGDSTLSVNKKLVDFDDDSHVNFCRSELNNSESSMTNGETVLNGDASNGGCSASTLVESDVLININVGLSANEGGDDKYCNGEKDGVIEIKKEIINIHQIEVLKTIDDTNSRDTENSNSDVLKTLKSNSNEENTNEIKTEENTSDNEEIQNVKEISDQEDINVFKTIDIIGSISEDKHDQKIKRRKRKKTKLTTTRQKSHRYRNRNRPINKYFMDDFLLETDDDVPEVVIAKGFAEPMSTNYDNLGLPGVLIIKTSRRRDGRGKKLEGVFTKRRIKSGSLFGPYVGNKVVGSNTEMDFDYIWEIVDQDSGELLFYIDASIPGKGCWMRYIRCATSKSESNMMSEQNDIEIVYRLTKDIKAGQEMLLYYPGIEQRKNLAKGFASTSAEVLRDVIELSGSDEESQPSAKKFAGKKTIPTESSPSSIPRNPVVADEKTPTKTSKKRTAKSTPKQRRNPSEEVHTPRQMKRTPVKRMSTPRKRPPPARSSPDSAVRVAVRSLASQLITPPRQTETLRRTLTRNRSSSGRLVQRLTAIDTRGTDIAANALLEQHGNCMPMYVSQQRIGAILTRGGVNKSRGGVGQSRGGANQRASSRPATKELRGVARPLRGVVKGVNADKDFHGTTRVITGGGITRGDVHLQAIANNMSRQIVTDSKFNKSFMTNNDSSLFDTDSNYFFTTTPCNRVLHKDKGLVTFVCDICGSAFEHSYTLRRHFMRLHVDRRYMNHSVKRSCQIYPDINYGLKEVAMPFFVFSCSYCEAPSLSSRVALRRHVMTIHLRRNFVIQHVPSSDQSLQLARMPRYLQRPLDCEGHLQSKLCVSVAINDAKPLKPCYGPADSDRLGAPVAMVTDADVSPSRMLMSSRKRSTAERNKKYATSPATAVMVKKTLRRPEMPVKSNTRTTSKLTKKKAPRRLNTTLEAVAPKTTAIWGVKEAAATSSINLSQHIMGTQAYLDLAETYCRADLHAHHCHVSVKKSIDVTKMNLPESYDLDEALRVVPGHYDFTKEGPYITEPSVSPPKVQNLRQISLDETDSDDEGVMVISSDEGQDKTGYSSNGRKKKSGPRFAISADHVMDERTTDDEEDKDEQLSRGGGDDEEVFPVIMSHSLDDNKDETEDNDDLEAKEAKEQTKYFETQRKSCEKDESTVMISDIATKCISEGRNIISPFKGWMNGLLKSVKSPIKQLNQCLVELDYRDEPTAYNTTEPMSFTKALGLIPKLFICKICKSNFGKEFELYKHHTEKHKSLKPSTLILKENMVPEWVEPTSQIGSLGFRSITLPQFEPGDQTFNCAGCSEPCSDTSSLHHHVVEVCPTTEPCRIRRAALASEESIMVDVDPRQMAKLLVTEKPYKVKTVKGRKRPAKPSNDNDILSERNMISYKRRYFDLDDDSFSNKHIHTSPNKSKNDPPKKKRTQFASHYDPSQHTRRRERTILIGLHNCGGCHVKFDTLTTLEKHVKYCKHKDKLQKLRAIAAYDNVSDCESMGSEGLANQVGMAYVSYDPNKPHLCIYCNVRDYKIKSSLRKHIPLCPARKSFIREDGEEVLDREWELKYDYKDIKSDIDSAFASPESKSNSSV